MKKGILIILLLLSLFLCSCRKETLFMSDSQISNEALVKVLKGLQNKDKEKLELLFSKNAIEKDKKFEADLEAMFDYFEGKNAEYEEVAAYVEHSRDEEMERKVLENSYKVTTSEGSYLLCMCIVVTDDLESDDSGILSLYIIKTDDYNNKEYVYWGDGHNTPGINIAIQ